MTALAAEHATMPVLGRLGAHASRAELIAHVAEAARQIRIQDAKLVHYAGAGHIGGALVPAGGRRPSSRSRLRSVFRLIPRSFAAFSWLPPHSSSAWRSSGSTAAKPR